MKILAIIPARGGSKGIPMKNIQKLAGKPLLEYTIKIARNSKMINRVLVSTDNKKIAEISKKAGAETPFLRPKKISGDDSQIFDTIKHALSFLSKNESYFPDIITLLQPSHPLRTTKMIDDSIKLLKKSKASSVLSVFTRRYHPYRSFWHTSKYLKPFEPNFENYHQRQKLPLLYYPTGSVYTFWRQTVQKYNSVFGPKIMPLIAKKNEIHLDVDNIFDLFMCEMTLLHWKNFTQKFKL